METNDWKLLINFFIGLKKKKKKSHYSIISTTNQPQQKNKLEINGLRDDVGSGREKFV